MLKNALSFFAVAAAVLLLAALYILSTGLDDDAQRRLDLTLGHLKDTSIAIERDARNARNLAVDNTSRLEALSTNLSSSVDQFGQELSGIYLVDASVYIAFSEQLRSGYNFFSARNQGRIDSKQMTEDFAALDQSAVWFTGKTNSFTQSLSVYLNLQTSVSKESRLISQELRQQGKRLQADTIFQSVQQILSKGLSGSEQDLIQIRKQIASLKQKQAQLPPNQVSRFSNMIAEMHRMVPNRRTMESELENISSGRFLRQVSNMKERVTRDYLSRLTTINESRILLNVYTVMLLLVLIYFGARLANSYRVLNRSHDELEERVQDRTQDLESAYQNLSDSQVQLVQAEKMSSLGQLVAGVMHEINTPLLYIKNNTEMVSTNVEEFSTTMLLVKDIVETVSEADGSSEVLQKQLADLCKVADPETIQENLEEISTLAGDTKDGLEQISELVQSLKDFSRLDRANEDRFDVREGLEKTLVITRNMIKGGIEVEKHFEKVPDILCAPSQINQIFINLITNAIQAMDGKGKLTLSTQLVEHWVEVVVQDEGCGISEEHISKVLDPFFTTKPVGKGTGLGLSIVNQIVEEHHGTIDISSKPGVGTRIAIRLPQADHDMKEERDVAAA
ncbi:MAG: GHKL domain-containing protein [Pseudomonadales bacterium]|nr:GHKL domain-containing protein [Pseudomonadales bacterium]